jgi:hypothetical protein
VVSAQHTLTSTRHAQNCANNWSLLTLISIVVALFVVAGFNVGTIRSSAVDVEQNEIINQWKYKTSDLESFISNVDTKAINTGMLTNCSKGLVLDWSLEPGRVLKITNHMASSDQQQSAMLHILKVANTYHDSIERVCCTNWAMQLSKDIKLSRWMTGVVREICIFEMIKSTWHQRFNRYAWVAAYDLKGHYFEYHDPEWCQLGNVFSTVAKLMLHHPRDKGLWVESYAYPYRIVFSFQGCIR